MERGVILWSGRYKLRGYHVEENLWKYYIVYISDTILYTRQYF